MRIGVEHRIYATTGNEVYLMYAVCQIHDGLAEVFGRIIVLMQLLKQVSIGIIVQDPHIGEVFTISREIATGHGFPFIAEVALYGEGNLCRLARGVSLGCVFRSASGHCGHRQSQK